MDILNLMKCWFKKVFLNRLWKKIAFILIFSITAPIFIFGYFLIANGQKAVEQSVLANYQEMVSRLGEEIYSIIEPPKEILLSSIKIAEAMNANAWALESMLVELTLNYDFFVDIVLVNLQGKVMASSAMQEVAYDKDAMVVAKNGAAFMSAVRIAKEHFPFMSVAFPYKQLGEIKGVFIAKINLKKIWNLVDNLTIGKTGNAYIVSKEGLLIAHKDRKRVYNNDNLRSHFEVADALRGNNGSLEKKDMVYAYTRIKDFNWGVVFEQKKEEAYHFSKIMWIHSLVILFLGELLVIVISLKLSRILSLPLKKLIGQMKNVANGDLDHQIINEYNDEIGDLIDTFNDMVEKLRVSRFKERLSAVGEASFRIAHEFKNSISSIKTYIQVLPQKYKDQDFIDRFLKNVPTQITKIETLLVDMSKYTKDTKIIKSRVDINDLIHSLADTLSDLLAEKKISLLFEEQTKDFIVFVDRDRIREVFCNIVLNAVQSIGEDGKITVCFSEQNGMLSTDIVDTGCGISEDILEKIFNPFFSTKNSGLGIGLAYCKKIIDLHLGEIKVNSILLQGTTFQILLPKN